MDVSFEEKIITCSMSLRAPTLNGERVKQHLHLRAGASVYSNQKHKALGDCFVRKGTLLAMT
jgi:hypothetical protein